MTIYQQNVKIENNLNIQRDINYINNNELFY
jgi:hypothetical protein